MLAHTFCQSLYGQIGVERLVHVHQAFQLELLQVYSTQFGVHPPPHPQVCVIELKNLSAILVIPKSHAWLLTQASSNLPIALFSSVSKSISATNGTFSSCAACCSAVSCS